MTDAHLPPIRGFLPSTMIDWPGRIAAMIFLPGCNFRCGYCHSEALLGLPHESAANLEAAPGDAGVAGVSEAATSSGIAGVSEAARAGEALEIIPFATVRDFLVAKKNWLGGLVICGGEPTLHRGLPELCRRIKALGYAIKLDTNGSHPEVLSQLMAEGLVDAISMDIKTILSGRMVELARRPVDLDALEATIDLLLKSRGRAAIAVEFRTTCCPTYVDAEVVEWIARRIGNTSPGGAADYVLQRFEPQHALIPDLQSTPPYGPREMAALLAAAHKHNPKTRLRNG